MYLELWSARFDPAVKILIYEGLLLDQDNQYLNHLPIIAQFLGLDLTQHQAGEEDLYRTVATLMSREEMLKHVHKFDDHFITEQGTSYTSTLYVASEQRYRQYGKPHRSVPTLSSL